MTTLLQAFTNLLTIDLEPYGLKDSKAKLRFIAADESPIVVPIKQLTGVQALAYGMGDSEDRTNTIITLDISEKGDILVTEDHWKVRDTIEDIQKQLMEKSPGITYLSPRSDQQEPPCQP